MVTTISKTTYQITASCESNYKADQDDIYFNNQDYWSSVIQTRVSRNVNPNSVAKQVIERYGIMIKTTLESMAGMLDEAELLMLLNANPTPFWKYRDAIDLATMLVESHGGCESLEESSPQIILADKLVVLSISQQVALTDLLERILRNSEYEKYFTEQVKEAGLLLKEHISHLDKTA
ncbi:hypothetical protein [Sulfuriferula nivalis]|uniref:Uncharacterized protein n=1 Tax=Sulfuriferula nivalis TaxID=2675298 RepID=A0A809S8K7_9PROT|nr:hypothetical protein [Sulfuriferula nivalis]BBP00603.1 hypothetical protein SFSGTM_13110 [Sulfuriferula nivalis]